MKLSQVKAMLTTLDKLSFKLERGTEIPKHFHITEVGMVIKNFIDCGGTIRTEKLANFQLWYSTDIDHRLSPKKLLDIIELSENKIGIEDVEVEVEYQSDTIGRYALAFDENQFILKSKTTACLAEDQCGIPQEKPRIKMSKLVNNPSACCNPKSGCC